MFFGSKSRDAPTVQRAPSSRPLDIKQQGGDASSYSIIRFDDDEVVALGAALHMQPTFACFLKTLRLGPQQFLIEQAFRFTYIIFLSLYDTS